MMGVFCEVYGNTVRNRVLENLLVGSEIGMVVPDLAQKTGISKPRAYQIIYEFERKGWVERYRMIGKTQIWVLNKKNSVVKLFMKSFNACLKLVVEEYKEKDKHSTNLDSSYSLIKEIDVK